MLTDKISETKACLEKARNEVLEYADSNPKTYVDIGHLVSLIKESEGVSSVEGLSEALEAYEKAHAAAVLYHGHVNEPDYNFDDETGMSIYFPKNKEEYQSDYESLPFTADTKWNEFLAAYYSTSPDSNDEETDTNNDEDENTDEDTDETDNDTVQTDDTPDQNNDIVDDTNIDDLTPPAALLKKLIAFDKKCVEKQESSDFLSVSTMVEKRISLKERLVSSIEKAVINGDSMDQVTNMVESNTCATCVEIKNEILVIMRNYK